jgi:mannose/cellobiose epimerase-like protein (N-acyl-D-glucosamine 2-epimerase family)
MLQCNLREPGKLCTITDCRPNDNDVARDTHTLSAMPDFRSPEFLIDHIRHTLDFYAPRDLDPSGGFFHFFKDDGTVYDRRTRHLVSSTRFVFNHAMAYRRFGKAGRPGRRAARPGLPAARACAARGGYAWQIDWHEGRATVQDGTHHCYGLAFVLLAHAHALMAGVERGARGTRRTPGS